MSESISLVTYNSYHVYGLHTQWKNAPGIYLGNFADEEEFSNVLSIYSDFGPKSEIRCYKAKIGENGQLALGFVGYRVSLVAFESWDEDESFVLLHFDNKTFSALEMLADEESQVAYDYVFEWCRDFVALGLPFDTIFSMIRKYLADDFSFDFSAFTEKWAKLVIPNAGSRDLLLDRLAADMTDYNESINRARDNLIKLTDR